MALLTLWPGTDPALHVVYIEAHGGLIFWPLKDWCSFSIWEISSENEESALVFEASMETLTNKM